MYLSKNFPLDEAIKSQQALRRGIDNSPTSTHINALMAVAQNILQPVRDHYNIPIVPSSFYRCPELCVAIGSSSTSQHAKGEAVDFEVLGVSNRLLAEWIIENLTFDQLILECHTPGKPNSGWVHCSYRADGKNRGQILTFDGRTYTPGLPE